MKAPESKPLDVDTMTQPRDPFGFASLPQVQPPTDGWIAISAQLQQPHPRRQQWFFGLALAATITLVIGVVALLPQEGVGPSGIPTESAVAQQEAASSSDLVVGSLEPNMVRGPGRSYNNPNLGPENLQTLQQLSKRLEQNLRYLRTGLGAVPAEMVVYQVELEDLVAQVDAAISQQPKSSELWRQRVNLLMDLNQIYGDGLRRDEPYIASL